MDALRATWKVLTGAPRAVTGTLPGEDRWKPQMNDLESCFETASTVTSSDKVNVVRDNQVCEALLRHFGMGRKEAMLHAAKS